MLVGLKLEQDRDYSGEVKSIGGELSKLTEKVVDYRDKQTDNRDPINLKKRELELLELQRKIDCYEESGGPCLNSVSGDGAEYVPASAETDGNSVAE